MSKEKFFLLADDDRDDIELFREALEEVHPIVKLDYVRNGSELMKYFEKGPGDLPDIIFLDINMPELSGWECLQRIKNNDRLSRIPVIMYSTSSAGRDQQTAIDRGAAGLLTKPANFRTLIRMLDILSKPGDQEISTVVKTLQAI